MAKIFGLHLLRLRPDVDEEEFEMFMAEGLPKAASCLEDAGWKPYLLKGDRGDRAGKYAWLWEIESTEALYRFMPTPEKQSDEFERFLESHAEELQKWTEFMEEFEKYTPCKLAENTIFTDYVVVAG